jgi:ATP-dependent Lon protease
LDRMYKIQTMGYEKKDKRVISNDYLIPKIVEQVNFKKDDIIIPDTTIDYIVENYTQNESGVRNLKRCLEIIYTKLNLYRLMKPDSNLFENEMTLKVEFPFTVTTDILKKIIKQEENTSSYLFKTMYV